MTVPDDSALEVVARELLRADSTGDRWNSVVRQTFDMVYNGQVTGHYRWDQLMKTEKTHFGSLFEINAQRHFQFEGGDRLDFKILGHEVDAKWSQTDGRWMLPPEVLGELALVATGDDSKSNWSLGLIRVTEDEVSQSKGNRDAKRWLSMTGRNNVRWLWRHEALSPNVLLQLDQIAVEAMLALRAGTKRTDELFRRAEGMLVSRTAVATVSRQLDAQKRVRYNGGSRSALQPEGYLIFSGVWNQHRLLAEQFGVPVPKRDEYVSVRVTPAEGNGVSLGGRRWRRAAKDEIITVPAPLIAEPKEDLMVSRNPSVGALPPS